MQQEIAQAVASALTLHIGLEDQPHEAVDPQVFREYLRLRSLIHNATDWPNDTRQAIPAMRALVARAPDYAAAHGLLALTLASGHLVPNAESEALQEANRALARQGVAEATARFEATKGQDINKKAAE